MICGYQQKRSGADRRDGTRAEGKEKGGRKGNRLDQKKKKRYRNIRRETNWSRSLITCTNLNITPVVPKFEHRKQSSVAEFLVQRESKQMQCAAEQLVAVLHNAHTDAGLSLNLCDDVTDFKTRALLFFQFHKYDTFQ
jgi:hypothetical protein